MNQHILFKLASRERPDRFLDTLENLYANIANAENFTIYCVLDEDDPTAAAYQAVLNGGEWLNLVIDWGHSKSKVHAINRRIRINWDGLLVNWSDDQRASLYGFDQLIRDIFYECFPKNDGLLHLPDQDAKEAIPVLYIADRKYFDRDGWIYHPKYKSVWCDNHSMMLAKLRNRYAFGDERLFVHLNPAYGHLPRDPMFDRQQAQWDEDKATYDYFESINFGV